MVAGNVWACLDRIRLQSSLNSRHGSTFRPFAIRAMLSIEIFRSGHSCHPPCLDTAGFRFQRWVTPAYGAALVAPR
jgi:hypothetical protein